MTLKACLSHTIAVNITHAMYYSQLGGWGVTKPTRGSAARQGCAREEPLPPLCNHDGGFTLLLLSHVILQWLPGKQKE